MSIFNKIVNVYIAPNKVFEAVKDLEWKKALFPMLILAIVGVIAFAFIHDLAADAGYEAAVERIENNSRISDDQKEEIISRIETQMESGPQKIIGWIASALGTPISIFFMALIALLVGNTFMGGSAKYGQLLNITSWAFMISILESIVKIPLMLNKWSLEVYTGLGVLDIGEKGSFINSLLAGIDVFAIWRVILIAIGMGVIYNKKTQPYAVGMLIAWFILKLIGAGASSFFGVFTG
jgi:hypothetical protein